MPEAKRHPRNPIPLPRALAITLAAQVAVAIGGLLVFREVARSEGVAGFADYALLRQAATLLLPLITVGLIGGLPRYLALRHGEDAPSAEAYLTVAAGMCGCALAICLLFGWALPGISALLLFGDRQADDLLVALAALLVATVTFQLAYGWFRGLERLGRANALQVLGAALPPPLLAFVVLDGDGVKQLVLLAAAALAAASLVVLLPALAGLGRPRAATLRSAGSGLGAYGPRRIPGELAQVGLFALAPVLAAHLASTEGVAYVTAGLQVVLLLTLALNPLGVVLLPMLARGWRTDEEATRQRITGLSAMAAHLGLFALGQALVLSDLMVRVWLGPDFEGAAGIVRVMVAPVALVLYYLVMRSSLDAVAVRSYNSRSNVAGLLVFLLVVAAGTATGVADPAWCVAGAFAAGLATQGALTAYYVRRVVGVALRPPALSLAIAAAAAATVISLAARLAVGANLLGLTMLVVLACALGAAYLLVLRSRGVAWLQR